MTDKGAVARLTGLSAIPPRRQLPPLLPFFNYSCAPRCRRLDGPQEEVEADEAEARAAEEEEQRVREEEEAAERARLAALAAAEEPEPEPEPEADPLEEEREMLDDLHRATAPMGYRWVDNGGWDGGGGSDDDDDGVGEGGGVDHWFGVTCHRLSRRQAKTQVCDQTLASSSWSPCSFPFVPPLPFVFAPLFFFPAFFPLNTFTQPAHSLPSPPSADQTGARRSTGVSVCVNTRVGWLPFLLAPLFSFSVFFPNRRSSVYGCICVRERARGWVGC